MSYQRASDRFLRRQPETTEENLATKEIIWITDSALPAGAACVICNRTFDKNQAEHCRIPVRLSCHHIFGSVCISRSLQENKNGCPKCHRQLSSVASRLSIAALLGPEPMSRPSSSHVDRPSFASRPSSSDEAAAFKDSMLRNIPISDLKRKASDHAAHQAGRNSPTDNSR